MRARSLFRLMSYSDILSKLTPMEDKMVRKVDVERKALIAYQQEALKQGKIEPMIHIIEKLQIAVKENQETPIEKIERVVSIAPGDSYNTYVNEFTLKFGNFALDLYGTEKDNKLETIKNRGELVPAIVRDEDAMFEYRKYFVVNYSIPGSIENIHPHKFMRLKPIEEFPLLPLIPISPMTLNRWKEELEIKKKEGYRFRIDKGKIYTGSLVIMTCITFLVLLYFLFNQDEENWVQIEKSRRKKLNYEFY